MENTMDFLKFLPLDMALIILMRLDDPADLIRASAVSQFWNNFVIRNGLMKQLCLRVLPQLSQTAHIIDDISWSEDDSCPDDNSWSDYDSSNMDDECSWTDEYSCNMDEYSCNMDDVNDESMINAIEMEILERDHKVYAALLQAVYRTKVSPADCIIDPINASSAYGGIQESIVHTLSPCSIYQWDAPSYWSSLGVSDPNVAETLTYKLKAGLTIVTEIDIRPFQVYWEPDQPICSAKSVRFRMGHSKYEWSPSCRPDDNDLVWTYTSPVFPMKQENNLQPFKLPEPVLCIGGFLQIELLGRAGRLEFDGLFYTCICYVRVLGLPLAPGFMIAILNPIGEFCLEYCPYWLRRIFEHYDDDNDLSVDTSDPVPLSEVLRRVEEFQQMTVAVHRNPL